jgi:SAM-dependent methyltransferase
MRIVRRLASRLRPILQSDTAFIEEAYREILGREVDRDGLDHYKRVLRDGLSRSTVLLDLMRSEESISKLRPKAAPLISLHNLRPDQYRHAIDRTNGHTIDVFEAKSAEDFDWLEQMILTHGYYEKPGVWNLGVDFDKRTIAEMIASFAPARALEIGCAAGAVLSCLDDLGIRAEGVEISANAIAQAPEQVRPRIHHGDLLALDLPPEFDLVFGLDVFEHLNPNRLGQYIERIARLLRNDGRLFCNIPAFGSDPMFDTVFPLYVDDWHADAASGRPFSVLHVDEAGYPLHGHLIWADSAWWVAQFERRGFRREVEIERALHAKYDAYMDKHARARKAYYVFEKRS